MAATPQSTVQSAHKSTFESFLTGLSKSFKSRSISDFIDLFLPNGYHRDILICHWGYASVSKDAMDGFFQTHRGLPRIVPGSVKVDTKRSPPICVPTLNWVQGFFVFETDIALGEGIIRIQPDPLTGIPRALTLSLTLHQFKNHAPIAGPNRPIGVEHGPIRSPLNWLEERELASSFGPDSPHPTHPTVIIVGAGHSGLMLAARLKRSGIVTLIIDKQERLGDSWRKRYHSLVLHNSIWANAFPYLPFPDNWPVFIPKDKLANWFESYASIMELNVWLKTTVEPGSTSYDEATETWTLTVRKGDGSLRELKCKHIVQATGPSGEPNIPSFEGQEAFKGSIHHSSAHEGGAKWKGKKAVVIGCCNSGHDIAHEFYNTGAAEVTMVQRSSTLVISSEKGLPKLMDGSGHCEGGPPVEEADLGIVSFPWNAFEPYAVAVHAAINEEDKDIIDGLERAGFKIKGKGGPGLFYMYLRNRGGYYVDVGCSSLIIDGKVKIKQGQEIQRFEENGIRFEDGSFLEADVVVLATGYKSMQETCYKIFGAHVANQTGTVWGMDPTGEINGVWRYSGCPGFWYMGGDFMLSRAYSKYVALWIQAIEENITPKRQSIHWRRSRL